MNHIHNKTNLIIGNNLFRKAIDTMINSIKIFSRKKQN